jgi:agmatine deiminase
LNLPQFCYRYSPALTTAALAMLMLLIVTPVQASSPMNERSGSVRMCAEWEPAIGTLIRWPLGIPAQLVVELARDDSLFVLVQNQSQQNQAYNTFLSWGVNTDHCRFIHAATYSHWTRDWGPHSVFDEEGNWGILDPIFDGYPWVPGMKSERYEHASRRGWEQDDAVNGVLAADFQCQLWSLPAYLTGGNIMVDGMGFAYSTQQMLDENAPLMSEADFRFMLEEYAGIIDYRILSNIENYGLQHIDCAAKLLNEETVLIQELPSGHPDTWRMDRLVSEFESLTTCYGRPYRIVRIFCGSYDGNATAAYTNSLILNTKVLVPMFGIASDSAALETYRSALPGYDVIGIAFPGAWYYYDALHCRTMGIFDRHMLRLTHAPIDSVVATPSGIRVSATIDDRSEAGLVPAGLKVTWRKQSDPKWDSVYLELVVADSFHAYIPDCHADDTVEYYVSAADSSGRTATLPRGAPDAVYRVTVLPAAYVCGDIDGDGTGPNVTDLTFMVAYLFGGGPEPPTLAAADVNGDGSGPDISDLTYLVAFLFSDGNPLNCP